MKKFVSILLLFTIFISVEAQTKDSLKLDSLSFTTIQKNAITSIKNQSHSGTCWAYSGLGFFESELLRLGKGEHELSRLFIARKTYMDRAINYVRFHGDAPLGQGGSFYDVVYGIKNYGLIPQEVYSGLATGDSLPDFSELDPVMTGYIKALVDSKNKKLSNVWKEGYEGILDAYFGKIPEEFTYKGKKYTPKSYAESLGLNLDDYVSLTSYSHHPFYTEFSLEIQDNWRQELSYNLPIDELMQTMDYAVRNGYSFAWGSDVSEKGFDRKGLAIISGEENRKDVKGSDADNWLGLSKEERQKKIDSKQATYAITQEMRQKAFDNWETTDDHGMVIFGLAKDQLGREYYMVKNSWGEKGDYKGIWYASKPFVAYKTMNILINKNAIPKDIRKKLGIK
ncbi:MAG: C1 family peptidase [Bacteroidaceae bacterium]